MKKFCHHPFQVVLCLIFIFVTSGCSVRMAYTSKVRPDLASIAPGQSRADAIKVLGQPEKISAEDNLKVEYYDILYGSKTLRFLRGTLYLFLDVGTVGLWELLGIPLERFIQDEKIVTVEYDENDTVIRVIPPL